MNTAGPGLRGHGLGVSRLIDDLRREGFQISASEAVDATQLLLALSGSEPALTDASALRARLRPIFCKSRDEQLRFNPVFDAWLDYLRADSTAHTQDSENGEGRAGVNSTGFGSSDPAARKQAARTARRYLLLATAVAAIAGLIYWLMSIPNQVAAPIVEPPPVTDQLSRNGTDPVPQSPDHMLERYVPELRTNMSLHAAWAWVLILLPVTALLGVSLPALALERSRLRRSSDPMYLDPQPLAEAARRLVPPLRQDINDRLARHLYSAGLDIERMARRPVLDVRGTLESTFRNDGIPKLKFSHSRVHPSYLVLVDVANERDPRGRLFFQWAERMQREGLDVEILLICARQRTDSTAAVEFAPLGEHGAPGRSWLPLSRLRSPRFGERLILVSDGNPLVDADGRWHAAALRARFSRWRDRVIFTPVEPRDWSEREELMERRERPADPGFIVLPLEESALAAWTDFVWSGRLSSIELADPERFPALLRKRDGDYLSDVAPARDKQEKLISQLRVYLGQWGFYWLVACAVPPLVRWELTLILGEEVMKSLPPPASDRDATRALSRYYRRLVKLPWMQCAAMPQWLRLRLLLELSAAQHREMQELVRKRLGELGRQQGEDGIQLNFERPPGGGGDRAMTRIPVDPSQEDALYLGYTSGLTPEQLVLRAPREWSAWTSRIQLKRPQGMQGWLTRLRDHTTAWWARLAWTAGLPHLGVSRRGLIVALSLALPLVLVIVILAVFPREARRSGEGWLVEERSSPLRWYGDSSTDFALSRDGSRLATLESGVARIVDVRSGRTVASVLTGGTTNSSSISFSQDDKHLGVSVNDRLAVYATSSLKEVAELRDNGSSTWAFAPDGTVLILRDATVHRWQIGAPTTSPVVDLPDFDGLLRFAFSRDGTRIISATGDAIRQWDSRTGQLIASAHLEGIEAFGAFADIPGTSQIAAAGPDGALHFWDIATGRAVGATPPREGGRMFSFARISNLAASADGIHIAVQDAEGIVMWKAHAASVVREVEPEIAPMSVVYSDDGSRVAVGDELGAVHVRDESLDAERDVTIETQGVGVVRMALSPDGARLVTVNRTGSPKLWNVSQRQEIRIEPIDATGISSVAFSPDGTNILFGTLQGVVFVDARSGELLQQRSTDNAITDLAFDNTGTLLAAVHRFDGFELLDGRTGVPLSRQLVPDDAPVQAVAFSSDGKLLATGDPFGSIHVWDVAKGGFALKTLSGHRGPLIGLGFTQGDARIVSAATDSTVRVWDAQTGEPIGSTLYRPGLRHMAVSRQGGHFVTLEALLPAEDSQSTAAPDNKSVTNRVVHWRVDPLDAPQTPWRPERLLTKIEAQVFAWGFSNYTVVGVATFMLITAALPRIRRRKAIARLAKVARL